VILDDATCSAGPDSPHNLRCLWTGGCRSSESRDAIASVPPEVGMTTTSRESGL
jgi:hypothetical protein